MARRRRTHRRSYRHSYARENQLVEVDSTDLLIGGAVLVALVGVGYLAYNANAAASLASSVGLCLYSTGLNTGYCWAPQGNTAAPAVGSIITAFAQDSSGNSYPVSGQVTAFDGSNVTFAPVQLQTPTAVIAQTTAGQQLQVMQPSNPALAGTSATIQLPLAFVAGCLQSGLSAGSCWVATGNTAIPAVGDYVMAWVLNASGQPVSFQGTVIAVSPTGNVTFTRMLSTTRPVLANPAAATVTVPLGFLYDVTQSGASAVAAA